MRNSDIFRSKLISTQQLLYSNAQKNQRYSANIDNSSGSGYTFCPFVDYLSIVKARHSSIIVLFISSMLTVCLYQLCLSYYRACQQCAGYVRNIEYYLTMILYFYC